MKERLKVFYKNKDSIIMFVTIVILLSVAVFSIKTDRQEITKTNLLSFDNESEILKQLKLRKDLVVITNDEVIKIEEPAVEFLGQFKITAYCPCEKCSEGYGRSTASGAIATANHTIAADPRVIPYGTKLLIDGQEYVVEDCGGAIKNKRLDIFFDTHSETLKYGVKLEDVYIIK